MSTTEIFIAYSQRDKKFADKVLKHLKPLESQGLIFTSYDDNFLPGSDWNSQIKKHINQANIILLLISADFLASSHFEAEIQQALKRQEAGDARIIPVIVRPVSWRGTPLNKLQALPTGGKPVTSWANPDIAFIDIAQGIRKAVAELTQNTPHSPIVPSQAENVAETIERAERMKHLANLEDDLRRSYYFIRDYESISRLSNDPKEKQLAQKSIENRLPRIQVKLSKYMELANEIGVIVPEDIILASARLEDISNRENVK